jgi:hypothetical protein
MQGTMSVPFCDLLRQWRQRRRRSQLDLLLEGVDPELLRPPVNVLRLSLHPRGLAPRIVNLGEWREHVLGRLRRQVELSADGQLCDYYLSGKPPAAHPASERGRKENAS